MFLMVKNQIKVLQSINLTGFLGTIIVNMLANILPINGMNTGQISDYYPNLFVPAGLTFSIWGVIYFLLALFTIFQFKKKPEIVREIGPWFGLASIFNVSWIFLWHYLLIPFSLIAMLGLFVSLLAIYLKLKIGKSNSLTSKEKLYFHIPFSVYLGWITVATIANVTAVAVDASWSGWGISEEIWTVLVILVALIITLLMLLRRKDIAYALVVGWASLGIYIKRTTIGFEQPLIATIALIVTVVILSGIVLTAIKAKK